MKNFVKSGIAGLAFIATGCTGVVIQDVPGAGSRFGYYNGEFDYAVRKGAIVTIVAGNPFGGTKEAFDDQVRRLMKDQNRGVPAKFVAKPGARTDEVFRVVIAFNMPVNISAHRMCEGPMGLPGAPHTGNLRMDAAFCHGDALQSDTFGIAYKLSGIDDPKFAELVRGVTHAMVPADTETDGDDPILP